MRSRSGHGWPEVVPPHRCASGAPRVPQYGRPHVRIDEDAIGPDGHAFPRIARAGSRGRSLQCPLRSGPRGSPSIQPGGRTGRPGIRPVLRDYPDQRRAECPRARADCRRNHPNSPRRHPTTALPRRNRCPGHPAETLPSISREMATWVATYPGGCHVGGPRMRSLLSCARRHGRCHRGAGRDEVIYA